MNITTQKTTKSTNQVTTRVRRKSSTREFERRFLSEKYRGGAGTLEVAMIWENRILSVDQFDKDTPVTIGEGESAVGEGVLLKRGDLTYLIEHSALGKRHELFTPQSDGQNLRWTLNVTREMEVTILVDPAVDGLTQLNFDAALSLGLLKQTGDVYSLTIDGGTRARIKIGDVTILAHYASTTPLRLVRSRTESDRVVLFSMLAALMLMLVGGAAVYFYPDRSTELNLAQSMEDGRLKTVYQKVKEQEVKEAKRKVDIERKKKRLDDLKKKPDPVVTKTKSTAKKSAVNSDQPTGEGPSSKQPTDIENYNTVLNAAAADGALSSLAQLGLSGKSEGALGGLRGFNASSGGQRAYALAQTGSGIGGGGDGGPGGSGGPGGDSLKRDRVTGGINTSYNGEIVERALSTPILRPGKFTSGGTFDRNIIKRVMARNKSKIVNCYESQLRKKRDLQEKIMKSLSLSML